MMVGRTASVVFPLCTYVNIVEKAISQHRYRVKCTYVQGYKQRGRDCNDGKSFYVTISLVIIGIKGTAKGTGDS